MELSLKRGFHFEEARYRLEKNFKNSWNNCSGHYWNHNYLAYNCLAHFFSGIPIWRSCSRD